MKTNKKLKKTGEKITEAKKIGEKISELSEE